MILANHFAVYKQVRAGDCIGWQHEGGTWFNGWRNNPGGVLAYNAGARGAAGGADAFHRIQIAKLGFNSQLQLQTRTQSRPQASDERGQDPLDRVGAVVVFESPSSARLSARAYAVQALFVAD